MHVPTPSRVPPLPHDVLAGKNGCEGAPCV